MMVGTAQRAHWGPRRRQIAGRLSPDAWCLLAIAGTVLAANLLYVTGIFDPNPLAMRSGLAKAVAGGLLPGQPTIDPNVGFVSQALGHRAALDLVHLQLPWWNPYEGTGAPLAGELQSAAFFPPTLLTLFSNGQLYEHMLLELVAGGATYLLLRRLEIGRWVATAAGIAFALNGTFAWFAHAPVNPVAFLPLLLLGLELAYSAALDGRRGSWWLIALAGALSLYAGFPEVALLDALLGMGWFAWRCGCLGRSRAGSFVGKAAIGTAVAALLCAPLLIAALNYLPHANLGAHAGGLFGQVHLPVQSMPQLVLPYVFGSIFALSDPKLIVFAAWDNVGGFLSSSLLVLVLLGLLSRGRRGLRLLLGLWLFVVLARTYNTPPFVTDLVNLLPGLSNVAVFRYGWPSIELAAVVLAAIGLEGLVRSAYSRRVLLGVGVVSLIVLGIASGAAWHLVHQFGGGLKGRA
ncbi:MAG TPA: hypothetical protein VKR21_00925, partial [Solirubrobacteraceae bacterium]|nr:hypothetical protein [Solirubrobacteraceae bacterium]